MRSIFTLVSFLTISSGLMAQSLSGVESVEYDPVNNRYLASSDGTAIVAIAPNGALSHFGNGTQADYGMEMIGNTLYAIVGGSIKGYDLTSEQLVMSQSISGANFLNGMASNGVDSIWFTDFGNKDIYAMDINAPTDYTMLVSNTVETPNGIVYDGENSRCIFTTWDNTEADIKAMDLNTHTITYIVDGTNVGKIDGIDKDGSGNWFISSWNPARITKYNNDFSISELVTVSGIINPADICYSPETDTLAIPGGNQVLFVGFENGSVGIEDRKNGNPFNVYYNHGFPVVQFELSKGQDAVFEILDLGGRNVYTVFEGPQPKGKQTVVLSSIGLYSGAYLCRLTSNEISTTERIIIP